MKCIYCKQRVPNLFIYIFNGCMCNPCFDKLEVHYETEARELRNRRKAISDKYWKGKELEQ